MNRIFITIFAIVLLFCSNALADTYTVRKGDSLYSISKKFGVTVRDIKAANNRLTSNALKPGRKLTIPTANTAGKISYKEAAGYHIVREGDTLFSISKKYSVSVDALKELNGLSGDALKPGQRIALKKTGPRTYKVKKGDTLYKIAKKFGTTTDELKRLNGLRSNKLSLGQGLFLDEVQAENLQAKAEEPPITEAKILATVSNTPNVGIRERLKLIAEMMLDIPYRFGGSSFKGMDCSAYVQKVFSFVNILLPRAAREQFKVGIPISKEELTAGDLVFFRTYASFPSHVGIYLRDNLFIHASSRDKKVTIDSLDTPYYARRFIGAKRLISEPSTEEEALTADDNI